MGRMTQSGQAETSHDNAELIWVRPAIANITWADFVRVPAGSLSSEEILSDLCSDR